MNRPSFEELYMRFALDLARRSHHKTLNVGCVIVADDYSQVYAIGYNGNYKGGPNHSDSDIPGHSGDIHAEQNALIKCSVSKDTKKIIFVTHSPCIICSKMIINIGNVEKVYYNQTYRLDEGIKLLNSVGIKTEEFKV